MANILAIDTGYGNVKIAYINPESKEMILDKFISTVAKLDKLDEFDDENGLLDVVYSDNTNNFDLYTVLRYIIPATYFGVKATNEMDPAQLDRFIKIKVGDNTSEWLKYGKNNNISTSILNFIKFKVKPLP